MTGIEFGPYRVVGELAVGGMAMVYEATHGLLGRPAAIKVLHPHMSAQHDLVRRFFQEAQAAARIAHPGIVAVLDVGYTPGGQAYIVMERLVGETLRCRMKRAGPLPIDITLTVIRQLASAIGAAHQAGIVHRDLSPQNLFLVRDPEVLGGERIKVLDFGLAKLTAMAGTRLTGDGMLMGTPGYMAPEQCGDAANVDERADLYAIGCILYHCLCGRPPFERAEVSILKPHPDNPPVRPGVRRPEVPAFVDALAMQLLEKFPSRRLPSCAALMADLEAGGERAPGDIRSWQVQGPVPTPSPDAHSACATWPVLIPVPMSSATTNPTPRHASDGVPQSAPGPAGTEITTRLRMRPSSGPRPCPVPLAAPEPSPDSATARDAAEDTSSREHQRPGAAADTLVAAPRSQPPPAAPLAPGCRASRGAQARRPAWRRLWWGAAGLALVIGLSVVVLLALA